MAICRRVCCTPAQGGRSSHRYNTAPCNATLRRWSALLPPFCACKGKVPGYASLGDAVCRRSATFIPAPAGLPASDPKPRRRNRCGKPLTPVNSERDSATVRCAGALRAKTRDPRAAATAGAARELAPRRVAPRSRYKHRRWAQHHARAHSVRRSSQEEVRTHRAKLKVHSLNCSHRGRHCGPHRGGR